MKTRTGSVVFAKKQIIEIFGVEFVVLYCVANNALNVWWPLSELHTLGRTSKLGVKKLREYFDMLGEAAEQLELMNTYNRLMPVDNLAASLESVVTLDDREEGFSHYIITKLLEECKDVEVKALLLEMTKDSHIGIEMDRMVL